MISMFSLSLLAAVPSTLASPCATFRTASDLDAALYAAESAFERREKDALIVAERGVTGLLPCMREAVSTPNAARIHRVEGFTAFILQDNAGAMLSFASARAAEPGYLLPTLLVPLGHPMRALYDSAGAASSVPEELPAMAGFVRADGRVSNGRPIDRPTVLQHFTPSGEVTLTVLLAPGEPLPSFPPPEAGGPQEPKPLIAAGRPIRESDAARRAPPTAVVVGVGAGAGVAVGLYVIAMLVRSDYDRLDATNENLAELDSLYATNHGLVVASGVTGGLTLVAGVGAFTVRW